MMNYPDNSDILKVVDNMKIEILDFITVNDSKAISNFIKEENKIKPHMIEKTPEDIFLSAKNYGCVKLIKDGNIIGFMGLYNYGKYYEAGSLCIWNGFRSIGLGTLVQKLLLDKFSSLAIFLVTNTQKVRNISAKTGLFETEISKLSKNILQTIEKGGKILSDDSIYFSKQLFFNESLNSINEKEKIMLSLKL